MRNCTYQARRIMLLALAFVFALKGNTQQVAKNVTGSNGVFIGFYEYKPSDYSTNPSSKYPLIIFLHGIGERGNGSSELPRIKSNAIPKYIDRGHKMRFYWNGKWQTFLVLSPQLASNYGNWQPFYVEEMIKYAKSNLNIDTNRIFLTGLSLGGGGVWSYSSSSLANAQKLAGIAPVCGTCSMSRPANIVNANLPVWAFHASNDGTVSVNCTHNAVTNLNNLNPSIRPIKSIYNDGNHGIWDRSYDTAYKWHEPNIFEWFLGQNKSLPANILPTAHAGDDLTVSVSVGTASLDASSSSDADGTIVKYIWKKIAGPASGLLSDKYAARPSLSGLALGTYQYELTVVDNRTSWTKDTVEILVEAGDLPENKAPQALAGSDVEITLPVNSVTLSGSASSDVDGIIRSYAWTKISGPSAGSIVSSTNVNTTVNNLVAGTYQFMLVVTDDRGATGKDTVQVKVNAAPPPPNRSPVSNAGADVSLTLPNNVASLDGSKSTDPDGTITSYEWSKISGPVAYTIQNNRARQTSVSGLTEGRYEFTLKVTDDQGATSEDIVIITVNPAPPPPNRAPLAKAGTDIVIRLPVDNCLLNGSASSDPDGSIVSYSWRKISGPASLNIATPDQAATNVSSLTEGSYIFELMVTDDDGASGKDTIKVVVNPAPVVNKPPVANAGSDINITLPVDTVVLNGVNSDDPDGTIVEFNWSKISGPAGAMIQSPLTEQTSVAGLQTGIHVFVLTVTDNEGAIDKDTLTITVSPRPNQAPLANAGSDIVLRLPVNDTRLSGAASLDSDGSINAYSWRKISGPVSYNLVDATNVTSDLNNLVEGSYIFELVVTDNEGAIGKDSIKVVVNAALSVNMPPVANAGADVEIALPATSVVLNGSNSDDPDGAITSYSWEKILGPSGTIILTPAAKQTRINGFQEGIYLFKLTVTDDEGASGSDTIQVRVLPAPNRVPVAKAGADVIIRLPLDNCTLNAAASSDADGTIMAYAWRKISGPASFSIQSPSQSTTNISQLVQGSYLFELTVTDDDGASGKDSVKVVVNPAVVTNKIPVADAGNDVTITLPLATAQLNGSRSDDPDGILVSYSWVKLNGPAGGSIGTPSSEQTTIENLQEGIYTFVLTVVDDQGASDKDTVQVRVNPMPSNQLPVARAGADGQIRLPQNSYVLNATESYDPDGTITSFKWSKVSGPANFTLEDPLTATTNVSGLIQGTYVFEVEVTDDRGGKSKDNITVTVLAGLAVNAPPIAYAGEDLMVELPVNVVNLNGSGSYDPDGAIVSYAWSRISGPGATTILNSSTKTPTVVGLREGVYTFRLTVQDDKGQSATDDIIVQVSRSSVFPPVANAGDDTTLVIPTNSALLDGSGSSSGTGNLLTYVWKQITGPSPAVFSETNGAIVQVKNLRAGTYTFELTVSDNLNMISRDTVLIKVVDNFRYEESLNISPNPARGRTVITVLSDSTGDVRGTIYNLQGVVVARFQNTKSSSTLQQHIDVSHLPLGLYIIEMTIGNKKRMLGKMFKQ